MRAPRCPSMSLVISGPLCWYHRCARRTRMRGCLERAVACCWHPMRPERLCGWPVLTLVWWICCADDTMFMRASDIVDEGAQGGSGRGYRGAYTSGGADRPSTTATYGRNAGMASSSASPAVRVVCHGCTHSPPPVVTCSARITRRWSPRHHRQPGPCRCLAIHGKPADDAAAAGRAAAEAPRCTAHWRLHVPPHY